MATAQAAVKAGRGMSKALMILIAVGGVVIAGAVGFLLFYLHGHPSLYIVNTSGADGVSVLVDGAPLAPNLKNAATESYSLVAKESVSSGKHKVEAKDASGKVLETFEFNFESGFGSTYLYAPARGKNVCFMVQTDEYKTSSVAPDLVKDRFKPLDPTRTIWRITDKIDYWFQDSPESVTIKTKKGSSPKNVIKRALRQAACNDPNFQG
jgi:hypothetical protein